MMTGRHRLTNAGVIDMAKTERPLYSLEFPHATHDFYKPVAADLTTITDWSPSLTRQEFAEESDINTIMARYEQQPWPLKPLTEEAFVDFTEIPDNLLDTLTQLEAAKDSFMRLPAKVRREFDNDPLSFVAFASDPNHLDQMREWGLAPIPEPQEALVPTGAPSAPASAPIAPPSSPAPAPAK